jgi:hypothetical protein
MARHIRLKALASKVGGAPDARAGRQTVGQLQQQGRPDEGDVEQQHRHWNPADQFAFEAGELAHREMARL